MYDMFSEHAEEQALYHAIATVGTLLLQIGDVGKQFYMRSQPPSRPESWVSSPDTVYGSADSSVFVEAQNIQGQNNKEASSGDSSAKTPDEGPKEEAGLKEPSPATSAEGSDSGIADKSPESTTGGTNEPPGGSTTEPIPINSTNQNAEKPVRTSTASSSQLDWDWAVTFEQFMASVLTEPALVKFFETRYEISPAIERFRNRRLLDRQGSISESPPKSAK